MKIQLWCNPLFCLIVLLVCVNLFVSVFLIVRYVCYLLLDKKPVGYILNKYEMTNIKIKLDEVKY